MNAIVRTVFRKLPVLAAAGVFFLQPALLQVQAQSARPDTRSMTCAQAQAMVKQRGTIVMSTGPTTYETFVADARYCVPRASSVRARFAPTKDNAKCPVGNRCYQNRNNR